MYVLRRTYLFSYSHSFCITRTSTSAPNIAMLQLLLFTFVIGALSLSVSAHRPRPSLESLTTCLTTHHVLNFSTNATQFTSLLDFSIQNLRFQINGGRKNIRLPDALILPATPSEVQRAFNCCCSSELKERWLLRVRSGGHSYEGLSYTADAPFVVLDLVNMRSISIDLETEAVWVQSGATLGELYYAISQTSPIHSFAAGVCSTVGVGGHISGGGNGLLARKYGLTADNVIDAEVMDAMGRLLDRRAMGEDLFWALCGGGGGSWGIVMAWKVKLVSVPAIVTSFMLPVLTEKSKIIEVLGLWQEVAGGAAAPDELYNYMTISGGKNETVQVEFKGVYLGNLETTLTLLTKIYPSLDFTSLNWKEITWIEAIAEVAGVGSSAQLQSRLNANKRYFKGKTDYVRSAIPDHGLEGMLDVFMQCPGKGNMYLYPWGGELSRKRPSEIAFPHQAGNLYKIEYQASWDGEKADKNRKAVAWDQKKGHIIGVPPHSQQDGMSTQAEEFLLRSKVEVDSVAWVRGLHAYMTPFVSSHPRAAYVNCIDLDLGDAFDAGRSYFLHNFPRLLRVKAQIDPHNIFNHPHSIPLFSCSVT